MSSQGSAIECLVEILDQILRIFKTDRQPCHAARDAGFGELGVAMAPLRRDDGQAAEALDAAKARGPLEDFQAIEESLRTGLSAAQIDADHAAEALHLFLSN